MLEVILRNETDKESNNNNNNNNRNRGATATRSTYTQGTTSAFFSLPIPQLPRTHHPMAATMSLASDQSFSTAGKNINTQNGGGGGIFRQILQSMNPAVCLSPTNGRGPCSNPLGVHDEDDEAFEMDYKAMIGPLLKDLKASNKARTIALQKLFKLTDKESQRHR